MSEFGDSDAKTWLELALEKDCSIEKAIYYALFFDCQRDTEKFGRAVKHFRSVYSLKYEKTVS